MLLDVTDCDGVPLSDGDGDDDGVTFELGVPDVVGETVRDADWLLLEVALCVWIWEGDCEADPVSVALWELVPVTR